MESLKFNHLELAKSIRDFKRNLHVCADEYTMPENIFQTMELKKLREKNDYEHYANPKQLDKLRHANFLNSVKLMIEKKKNRN